MKLSKILLISFFILIAMNLALPIKYFIRSYAIMYPYSFIEKRKSFIKNEGFSINIPGGLITKERDWYPFMLYHNDSIGFSNFMGKDLSLTILYNFGHFYPLRGYSSFFDKKSDYYSSFYGGYIVKDNNGKFAFNNGLLNLEEASRIPEYDYKYLVLQSLGCPKDKMKFQVEVDNIFENVSYIGLDNWYRVDSIITTNGVVHESKENLKAYIQYGKPRISNVEEEFPIIELKGRTYIRYFKENNITIFLYVMAPSEDVINKCDNNILSKTDISNLR